MPHSYTLRGRDRVLAVLLGAWILACDGVLKILARIGASCELAEPKLQSAAQSALSSPAGCTGSEMAGPSIVLEPHTYDGVLLGFVGSFPSVVGQVIGLALLLVPTILSILITRWDGRSNADPKALACVWAGAIALALPRLVGGGSAQAEIILFGSSFGIGALAFIGGLVWLGLRFIGERRG